MVDRYKSLLGSQFQPSNKSIRLDSPDSYRDTIRNANVTADRMKRLIQDYKRSATSEQQSDKANRFKQEQQLLRRNRLELYTQFKTMDQNLEDPKYLFIKKELLKTTQNQMNLEIEFNQQITTKKKKLDNAVKSLVPGSKAVQNALNDILRKQQEIKMLQESIKQCLQLFHDIKIITLQNSQKIDQVLHNVTQFNLAIEAAVINIDKSVMNQKRCQRKACCIIFLALIIIAICVGGYLAFR